MKKVYCLFEQSGTFKQCFIAKGFKAFDIDIENKFGVTDLQIDLFSAIELLPNGYLASITSNDLIIAFFPCTWFSDMNDLIFNGTHISISKWDSDKKRLYISERYNKRNRALECLQKLRDYCIKHKIPLIIENPNGHYLKENFGCPNIIHCRNIYGDYYKKPTMYYTYNCIINIDKLYKYDLAPVTSVTKQHGIMRSLMSTTYANNIINSIEFVQNTH